MKRVLWMIIDYRSHEKLWKDAQHSDIGDRISTLMTWRRCRRPASRICHQPILLPTSVTNMDETTNEHPSWDPKWFGFIKVAYLAIPISKGLNSTHSWYRIADSFGLTTTAVNIGIGCLKSVKRFWNSDNLFGGLWPLINSYQGQADRWFQSARYGSLFEIAVWYDSEILTEFRTGPNWDGFRSRIRNGRALIVHWSLPGFHIMFS